MSNNGGSGETWVNGDYQNKQEEDFEDEEETLSLCDLPTNDYYSENPSQEKSSKSIESEEEFNFCSWSQDLNECELCVADDVFFQGQIVPMGSSVIKHNCNENETVSSTMDQCSSGGCTSESSRSNSMNSSHHSSSSLNSTSTTASATYSAAIKNKLPKTRVQNQFQFSQSSPKPHVIISSTTKNGYYNNPNSRSGSWTLFRVGLVTTPEIGIKDLKIRNNCKRSSDSSHNSNSNNSKSETKNKKIQRSFFFNKKGVLFSSCKCSATVIGTVNSGTIVKEDQVKEKKQQRPAGKQSLSRHRTFEWIKQLSLETPIDQF